MNHKLSVSILEMEENSFRKESVLNFYQELGEWGVVSPSNLVPPKRAIRQALEPK